LTLTWTAVPGTTYRIESKTALNEGWTEDDGDVIAGDVTASKTITHGDTGQVFYRVKSLLR
jgi:hypothetical protein